MRRPAISASEESATSQLGEHKAVAKQLKTYLTSLGFFDQAVAAPSMKAALEAWGSKSNLFHQGFAREVDDPAIVEATMAKPGVVLKRPIGSNGPFNETADLPSDLPVHRGKRKPAKPEARRKPQRKKFDEKAARKAAEAFEREEAKREKERRKEEAARQKERERREEAVARAQASLDAAEREHAKRARVIEDERDALERRSQAEDARWREQKGKLEAALRRARS